MFALFRSRRSEPNPVVDAALLDTLAAADDLATADADAALTPERAAAQRAAILARLGAVDDDRRVLSFPPREAGVRRPRAPRPALGWMLTAAAAGLIVGVGTGRGIGLEFPDAPAPPPAPRSVAAVPPPIAPPAAAEPDDAILGEVEVALAGRGVEELQPLDALTPRVTLVASR